MLLCPAAYAGFWKWGGRNFRKLERNIDQNLKLSHSNFVPFFAQNQVKSIKKRSSLKFHPIFRPKSGDFEAKAWCQTCKGVACLNFSHFSEQFCNPGDPKGGGNGPVPPPKYAPAYVQANRASIICAVRCVFFLRGMLSYQTRKVSCLSFFG